MDEVVKIIKIQTEDSEKTVKGLKQEINDLRDALLNVEKGSDKYNQVVDKLIENEKELTTVMRAGKNEVHAAQGSYNALQNEMSALRKVWKETTDEAKRNEIGARINELNTELKALDESIGNNQRKVGSYEEALKTLNTQFASQRQELTALKTAMDNLDPSSEAYNQAFQRAAEITHNLQERQQQLKYSTTDVGDQLSNIRGIAANMAAGFSAVNAAMGLFGEENEEVAQALLKVQQMMALVQGLEGLDGFKDRTEGLSTAMKSWLKGTKEQTVALKAETTALKGQTVATEDAEMAQKGLNATMKANPIGVIITAVTLLITLFGGWIKKTADLIKSSEKFNKILIKVRSALAGVGNVIKNILLVPIKETIKYVETVIKVFQKLIDMDLSGAWDALKQGVNEGIEIVNEGYDVAGNYQEAYNRRSENLEKERLRKIERANAESRAKELDDTIKNNEAKLGSDWKYTEDGQKAYMEYFDSLMKMYDKDSDEYKNAQRDKWSYEKELNDRKEKEAEDAAKKEKERRDKAIKAAQDAQKKLEQQRKAYETTISSNSAGGGYLNAVNQYVENLTNLRDGFKALQKESEITEGQFNHLDTIIKGLDGEIKQFSNNLTNNLEDMYRLIREATPDELKTAIFDMGLENAFDMKEIQKLIDNGYANIREYVSTKNPPISVDQIIAIGSDIQFQRIHKVFMNLLETVDSESKQLAKRLNDETVKLFEDNLFETVNKELNVLQFELDKKKLKVNFELEEGYDMDTFEPIKKNLSFEMKQLTDIYESEVAILQKEGDAYRKVIEFVENNGLIPSDEYNNAIAKLKEIELKINELGGTYYSNSQALRKKYFEKELSDTEAHYDDLMHIMQNSFDRENNTGSWWDLFTPNNPKEEMKQIEEMYNLQMSKLEEIRDSWRMRLDDTSLSQDDRLEAEQALAQAEMDIADAVLEHQIETDQKKAESVQTYLDFTADAVNAIGSLFGGLADYYEADVEAQVKAGKMSEAEADQQFDNIKKMRIAEATINTITGALGAFMQASANYPAPWGQILGAIEAASVTAAGAAQIAKIKSSSRNGNGSSSVSAAAMAPTDTEVIPQYVSNVTTETDTDMLRNAISDGMSQTQLYVSVTDINDVQNKVRTTQKESTF